MPESTLAKPTFSPAHKTTVEKAGSYLNLISTFLGVSGVIGTAFVYLAVNFYVGDVDIKLDQQIDTLTIRVYNDRGQESIYHSPHFQLMPGHYHLEIASDGFQTEHNDIDVQFRKHSLFHVNLVETTSTNTGLTRKKKDHWWQLWR